MTLLEKLKIVRDYLEAYFVSVEEELRQDSESFESPLSYPGFILGMKEVEVEKTKKRL